MGPMIRVKYSALWLNPHANRFVSYWDLTLTSLIASQSESYPGVVSDMSDMSDSWKAATVLWDSRLVAVGMSYRSYMSVRSNFVVYTGVLHYLGPLMSHYKYKG
jgi:hypothetical protein